MNSLDYTNSLEPSDFADTLIERQKSARHALRPGFDRRITGSGSPVPDGTHPWATEFSQSESPVRDETSDRFVFVYYPQSKCGMWYKYIGKLPAVEPAWTNRASHGW